MVLSGKKTRAGPVVRIRTGEQRGAHIADEAEGLLGVTRWGLWVGGGASSGRGGGA